MEKVLGKITNARIAKGERDRNKRLIGLDGLVIEFKSEVAVQDGQTIEILWDGKSKPFKVREVDIAENNPLTLKE